MRKLTNIPPIRIAEYDYPLPDERIARYPLNQRDASRLMVYREGRIEENIFRNAVEYLPENSLLVYNNTRVIQARMVFQKSTGARIEVFCLEPSHPSDYALSLGSTGSCSWECMIGNLKKWKEGKLIRSFEVDGHRVTLTATRMPENESNRKKSPIIHFEWDNPELCFADILDACGELPIPPYLNRETEENDHTTYQTVYSKIKGSVAAPTAGLHFTDAVLNDLKRKNIETEELTLHVGAGTFQPVKADDIADHQMHAEVISVRKSTLQRLLAHEGSIIAVGTTSVRTLESLYYIGVQLHNGTAAESIMVEQWEPYENFHHHGFTTPHVDDFKKVIRLDAENESEFSDEQTTELSTREALQAIIDHLDRNHLTSLQAQTQIMIRPGFQFRIIEGMFTNFHQPKSTLLLLVSAFVGEDWKKIYQHALDQGFRFLSYGDSSLLFNTKD